MKIGKRSQNSRGGRHLKKNIEGKENKNISKKEIEPKSLKRDKKNKNRKKKWTVKNIFKFILLIIAIPFAALMDLLGLIGRKVLKPIFKFILKHWKMVLIILLVIVLVFFIIRGIYTYTNSLNESINQINNRLNSLDQTINTMVEKDQKLQEDLNLLSEQNGTTLEELEQKKKELEDKQNEVDKLQSEVSNLQKQVTSRGSVTSRSSKSIPSSNTSTVTVSKNEHQQYAHDLCINTYGWTENDFTCLVKLWNKESGWNPNAHNSSSGAHGIPQSLPASKMASEGSDYYTNGKTQIRWGLKYIKNRYGSPSAAWSHSQSHNWY